MCARARMPKCPRPQAIIIVVGVVIFNMHISENDGPVFVRIIIIIIIKFVIN